jgi:hypothetical protein
MKSNKITKIVGLASICILFQTSCSKDYLNLTPNNSITDDNFYKTEDDAIRATNAVYTPLQGLYNGAAWQILDIMSDDADKGGNGAGDEADINDLDNFTMNPNQPKINTYYSQCYQGVQRANLVIEKVPGIASMNESTRKRCLGEAYFLRAYYYYMLVRLFGDVPFYTKPITSEQSYTITRTDKSIVFDGIIADLIASASFLPLEKYSGENAGRVNEGSARGMLASVYLTLNQKEKAAEQALAVINSGIYDLNPKYGDNFNLKNENGIESLFEVQYRNVGGSFSFFSQGNVVNTWFAPRAMDLVVDKPGYGFNVPTQDFVNQYERDPTTDTIIDKRRSSSIWMPGDVYDGKTFPPSQDGSPRGYNVKKYFVSKNVEFADANGWSCAGNIPILRYAEVLLIAAEAFGKGAGDEYINKVRKRAGLADLQVGSGDFLEAVYKERRLEFSSEMHRWFDLIRHPEPGYMIKKMKAAGKTPSQKHYLMPLPQIEIDKNPNLKQNAEY